MYTLKDAKRIFSILLCACLLTGSMISCGQTDSGASGTTPGQETGAETESEGPRSLSAVPDLDYEGATYTVACRNTNVSVEVEEMTGEAVNDSIYTRNRTGEEYLNFKMDLRRSEDTMLEEFSNSFMAGETLYSAAITHIAQMANYARQGYFFHTDDVDYLDLDQPYWAKGVTDSLEINGSTFVFSGDINITDATNIWCVFFNKNLMEDLGQESPYIALKEGRWTLDYLAKSAEIGARDLNGDGEYSWNVDQFAVLNPTETLGGMFNSMGGRSVVATADGGLEFTLGNEACMNILQDLSDWASSGNKTIFLEANQITADQPWPELYNVFISGRGLYYTHVVNVTQELRDMEQEFGILPMPKYTEDQEGYVSSTQEWGQSAYAIPICAPNKEMAGAVIEYLGGLSTDTIRAAYYDSALTRKYTRDNESVESLDILFNNIVIDIGFAYNFGNARDSMCRVMAEGGELASTIASLKRSVEKEIKDTIDDFQELKDVQAAEVE